MYGPKNTQRSEQDKQLFFDDWSEWFPYIN